ncbi:MAG TPA: glycosyl transferase [Rhodospirillaceae bacterium]|nr:glycosyl transferase [Rhodospirillaceae bacterium]
MKILEVMAGAEHGGAETAFVDMCVAFAKAGQEIEVVTRDNDSRVPALEKEGLRVHKLPFGGRMDFYTPWRMKKIIREFRPDIVQTWMARAAAKTPKWAKGGGIGRYLIVSRLGGYYNIKYFKNADYFTTITPDIRRHLMDHGVAGERVLHINNFADVEAVENPVRRADLATSENAPVVLALGRLHPSKAFDTLIKVAAQMEGVYFWIAGEGPQRAELEKLIADLNVGARVKLLGWREDRAALLQAANICVFPSRYEPFGTVFVQAWAQKIPLVTTNADGPRQFVRDGEDGLVVEIDNVEQMRAAIVKIIDDKALAARLVQNGYGRYLGEFTKEKTVLAYLDYFREIRAREKVV